MLILALFVEFRAHDTFLRPALNVVDLVILRRTCRILRDHIVLVNGPCRIANLALKYGYYWLYWAYLRHLGPGMLPDIYLCGPSSGRDEEAQKEIIRAKKLNLGPIAREGNLELLNWAFHDYNGQKIEEWDVCYVAAAHGHIHILDWALEKGFPMKNFIMTAAAGKGRIEVLEWGRKLGLDMDYDISFQAASSGQLEALKWMVKHGAQLGTDVTDIAALNNHLDVLQWARANGAWWGRQVCKGLASHGQFDALKWAWGNGARWAPDDTGVCLATARAGRLDILQWARAKGARWSGPDICRAAVESRNHDILIWACENGVECPIFNFDSFDLALLPEKMREWMQERGYFDITE